MESEESFFTRARANMVRAQLLPSRVDDPVLLSAIRDVGRECFVPPRYRQIAYIDDELEIAKGRFLMEPRVFAGLLQEAGLRPPMKALVVACGSGYSAAILSRMGLDVVALDSVASMCDLARRNIKNFTANDFQVIHGPLTKGAKSFGPYHVIFVDGGVRGMLDTLYDQLDVGGMLLSVLISSRLGAGRAFCDVRSDGTVSRRLLFDAWASPLADFQPDLDPSCFL